MADSGVAAYYDRLARWNGVARVVGYGGGSDALTVHRVLADPRADGRATRTRLHDVIAEQLGAMTTPRVLDAGCGLGGTMLALADRWHGQYTGLTLSDAQAGVARLAIAQAQRLETIDVQVRSYDTPPAGPFDLIVAIESLVHSPDPMRSLSALAAVLGPGGRFAIVDDMPVADATTSPELAAFKHGWRCGALWSRDQYLAALAALNLTLVTDRDLSGDCRMRSLGQIRRLTRANRVAHALVPHGGFRSVMDSHRGGLALEYLHRTGLMHYRLLIARRS
jgi:SAM-dependent methyltransferase